MNGKEVVEKYRRIQDALKHSTSIEHEISLDAATLLMGIANTAIRCMVLQRQAGESESAIQVTLRIQLGLAAVLARIMQQPEQRFVNALSELILATAKNKSEFKDEMIAAGFRNMEDA